MRLLTIESALRGCSVAVAQGDEILSFLRDDTDSGQAASLVPMVEAAMREAKLTFAELDLIVATCGPGSFTGLRIGLATAQALGFASGVNVQGVTTLAAAAAHLRHRGRLLAVLPAGKGEVYAQLFKGLRVEGPPVLMSPESAQELGATGDAIADQPPDARDIVWLVAHSSENLLPAEPYYIRPPDAKPPRAFSI